MVKIRNKKDWEDFCSDEAVDLDEKTEEAILTLATEEQVTVEIEQKNKLEASLVIKIRLIGG